MHLQACIANYCTDRHLLIARVTSWTPLIQSITSQPLNLRSLGLRERDKDKEDGSKEVRKAGRKEDQREHKEKLIKDKRNQQGPDWVGGLQMQRYWSGLACALLPYWRREEKPDPFRSQLLNLTYPDSEVNQKDCKSDIEGTTCYAEDLPSERNDHDMLTSHRIGADLRNELSLTAIH